MTNPQGGGSSGVATALRINAALAALCFLLTVLGLVQFPSHVPAAVGSGPVIALTVVALVLCFAPAILAVLFASRVVPKGVELLDPTDVVTSRAVRRNGGIGFAVVVGVVLVAGQLIARAGGVGATIQSVTLVLITAALTGVFAAFAALMAFMIRRWGSDA